MGIKDKYIWRLRGIDSKTIVLERDDLCGEGYQVYKSIKRDIDEAGRMMFAFSDGTILETWGNMDACPPREIHIVFAGRAKPIRTIAAETEDKISDEIEMQKGAKIMVWFQGDPHQIRLDITGGYEK